MMILRILTCNISSCTLWRFQFNSIKRRRNILHRCRPDLRKNTPPALWVGNTFIQCFVNIANFRWLTRDSKWLPKRPVWFSLSALIPKMGKSPRLLVQSTVIWTLTVCLRSFLLETLVLVKLLFYYRYVLWKYCDGLQLLHPRLGFLTIRSLQWQQWWPAS